LDATTTTTGRRAASRKGFLAGAGTAVALGLAACGSSKESSTPGGSNPNTAAGLGTDQFGRGDRGILGYLLTLEYLEADFYMLAVTSGKLSGQALTLARAFEAQERQHVAALTHAIGGLGGSPPPRPKGQFQLTDQASILRIASNLETLGADAYLGELSRVSNKALLPTLLSIHTVEGRHAAAVNSLLGTDISPDGAFARPAFANDVLDQLKAFVSA
jgi:Ferritin-like domain